MHNNDILRQLTAALSLSPVQVSAIFALGGERITGADAISRMRPIKNDGSTPCTSVELVRFLDGLIIHKRGPRETNSPQIASPTLSNNLILKKLRIALMLKEADMLRIFDKGGAPTTPRALSPLFRKPGNKRYRVCSDAMLQSFLAGLTD